MFDLDVDKFVKVGKRNSTTECPLALAAIDALKARYGDRVISVNVLGDTMTITWKDRPPTNIELTKDVSDAIKQFDETGDAHFGDIAFGTEYEMVVDGLLGGSPHEMGTYRRKQG